MQKRKLKKQNLPKLKNAKKNAVGPPPGAGWLDPRGSSQLAPASQKGGFGLRKCLGKTVGKTDFMSKRQMAAILKNRRPSLSGNWGPGSIHSVTKVFSTRLRSVGGNSTQPQGLYPQITWPPANLALTSAGFGLACQWGGGV